MRRYATPAISREMANRRYWFITPYGHYSSAGTLNAAYGRNVFHAAARANFIAENGGLGLKIGDQLPPVDRDGLIVVLERRK